MLNNLTIEQWGARQGEQSGKGRQREEEEDEEEVEEEEEENLFIFSKFHFFTSA